MTVTFLLTISIGKTQIFETSHVLDSTYLRSLCVDLSITKYESSGELAQN